MIRAVIIDDEPMNVTSLQMLLEKYCPEVIIEGIADNSTTAYSLIKRVQPDLAFLDIELPYKNAFDLLNELLPIDFEIIFVTAFNNYAINAFKYSALDYLLKPVNITELQAAVKKAAESVRAKKNTNRVVSLLENLNQSQPIQQKMALPVSDGLLFVNIADFVRLEAQGNYTTISMNTQKKIIVAKTLGEFEEMLPKSDFSRIHHSHIINHNYIRQYHRGRGGYVEMEDGVSIEVSVRKKEAFLSKFK